MTPALQRALFPTTTQTNVAGDRDRTCAVPAHKPPNRASNSDLPRPSRSCSVLYSVNPTKPNNRRSMLASQPRRLLLLHVLDAESKPVPPLALPAPMTLHPADQTNTCVPPSSRQRETDNIHQVPRTIIVYATQIRVHISSLAQCSAPRPSMRVWRQNRDAGLDSRRPAT